MVTPQASIPAIQLDAEFQRRIQLLAQAQGRSSEALVLEAIGQYLEREEQRERERQKAVSAWHASRRRAMGRGTACGKLQRVAPSTCPA